MRMRMRIGRIPPGNGSLPGKIDLREFHGEDGAVGYLVDIGPVLGGLMGIRIFHADMINGKRPITNLLCQRASSLEEYEQWMLSEISFIDVDGERWWTNPRPSDRHDTTPPSDVEPRICKPDLDLGSLWG